MRCETNVSALLVALAACAVSLDDDVTDGAVTPDATAPIVATCQLLTGAGNGITGASGRVRVSDAGDDTVLIEVDTLHVGGSAVAPAVLVAPTPDPNGCLPAVGLEVPTGAALDPSALGDDITATLLATFAVESERLAYVQVSRGLEPVGVGVASWDAVRNLYVADADYLFTADRPAYGDAVLVDGDTVYAYGCRNVAFLTDACYVARVPANRVRERTAYQFYRDGGSFAADPDGAWPIFQGGRGLAVARRGARVYAAYAPLLGRALHIRSGLGPTGPWSASLTVAACELETSATFCTGVSVLEPVAAAPNLFALSYAIGSFESLSAEQSATRLVRVSVDALP